MATNEQELASVLAGSMAFGWTYSGQGDVDMQQKPLRGWLRLADDGLLEFETLVDDPWSVGVGPPEAPRSLFLSTRHGALLLPDIEPRVGWNHNMIGSKASVNTYRAPHMIFGLGAEDVATNRSTRLAVRFLGMGPWAGLDMSQTETEHTEEGLVSSAKLTLKSGSPQRLEGKLPGSLTLGLEGDWVLGSETEGQRVVITALRIVVEAKRPRPVIDLAVVLRDVQDLLGLLRGGLTLATPANLRSGEFGMAPSMFWSPALMRQDSRALMALDGADLRLSLDELGGLPGLARWCHLAAEHRDVTYALTSHYRDGPSTVDVSLLRLGVAIEFWVGRHKGRLWAKKRRGHAGGWEFSHSLAYHLGPVFAAFVGDVDKWASQFWSAYLDAKHPRGRSTGDELQWALARTGRHALTATLLNKAAGSRKAGNAWLSDWRHQQVGVHYRSL